MSIDQAYHASSPQNPSSAVGRRGPDGVGDTELDVRVAADQEDAAAERHQEAAVLPPRLPRVRGTHRQPARRRQLRLENSRPDDKARDDLCE